jgi:hypothetical protein
MRRVIFASAAILAGLLCFPGKAAAYLDPGSGSLLFQFIIAGALGAGVALKLFWTRIKLMFSGNKSEPDQSTDGATDHTSDTTSEKNG